MEDFQDAGISAHLERIIARKFVFHAIKMQRMGSAKTPVIAVDIGLSDIGDSRKWWVKTSYTLDLLSALPSPVIEEFIVDDIRAIRENLLEP